MSNLSQFFSSNCVGFTATGSNNTGVGGSVLKVFTASSTLVLPSAVCCVAYAVLGAGGRGGGKCGPGPTPGYATGGGGGGFAWKETLFNQPTPVTACIIVGSGATTECSFPAPTVPTIPADFPLRPLPPIVPAPTVGNIIYSKAGTSCICSTGLTTICATSGCLVERCFPTGVITPVQPTTPNSQFFGYTCSFGGQGIGGDINTCGGESSVIGGSVICCSQLLSYLMCNNQIFPVGGQFSMSGMGAGNLLGPGRRDSNGFGFGGAASHGRNSEQIMSGLLGTPAVSEIQDTTTSPLPSLPSIGAGTYQASGESGYIPMHTSDGRHFSLAKTIFTASGGSGICCRIGESETIRGSAKNGGAGGAYAVGHRHYFAEPVGVQGLAGINGIGTGGRPQVGNFASNPFLILCSSATFGGGGGACNSGPASECALNLPGAPGLGVIEYWTCN